MEDTELIQRNSVEMLLFYFKYVRCIAGHVGEVALKLLSTFTTFRVQFEKLTSANFFQIERAGKTV